MDPLILARLQFGVTTVYHFFFVPLTLGLSVITAIMETIYVRTGKEVYKDMAKFWGKLFVINFAMGVVTGIVQEFQFGMNWSEYSRFVGDIFGAPLAIEALMAFFVESVFIGVWIFGWDKLSKGAHAAAIWMVAIGANISALWILIANSFMQEPVGYVIENGRAVMTDFLALITNPNVWLQFPHTVLAGFTTAAFFVMGISAYHLLRKKNVDAFQCSFKIAAIIGAISIVLVGLIGHFQGQRLAETQPMKLAASEALWDTESPASFSVIAISDQGQRQDVFSIRIPHLLCLLTYNTLDCEILGINELQAAYVQEFGPGDYIPPVTVVFWAFRVMVGAGSLLLGLAVYAIFLVMSKKLDTGSRWLKLFVWAIALSYIANSAGWIMTEMGRVPWIVYELMLLENGVSVVVPSWQVLTTLLGYTLIYGVLMVVNVYLLLKYARAGIPGGEDDSTADMEQAPSLLGAQD
ncbi:MAG: cytochrome ubiquinol oxidase subunit I [Chloroflexota bacterium]|nr:cytochrome ubiquinol oxidase subunit I [Chloroflexota bacterium]